MSTLQRLLEASRETLEHARAKRLAKNDYKLLYDLVEIRRSAGLSQEDVALQMGVSQQAVSKVERYDGDPRLSTLRRYAFAIGATVSHTVELDIEQAPTVNESKWSSPERSAVSVKLANMALLHGQTTAQMELVWEQLANSQRREFSLAA